MKAIVDLYSMDKNEIKRFLDKFYRQNLSLNDPLKWEKEFENPVELADIIGAFIDNNDMFEINMWISLDKDFFLNVTDDNADQIIRYLFERYPY